MMPAVNCDDQTFMKGFFEKNHFIFQKKIKKIQKNVFYMKKSFFSKGRVFTFFSLCLHFEKKVQRLPFHFLFTLVAVWKQIEKHLCTLEQKWKGSAKEMKTVNKVKRKWKGSIALLVQSANKVKRKWKGCFAVSFQNANKVKTKWKGSFALSFQNANKVKRKWKGHMFEDIIFMRKKIQKTENWNQISMNILMKIGES